MSSLEYCIEKAKQLPFIKGQKRFWCVILDKRGRIIAEASNNYLKTSAAQYRAAKRVGLEDKCYLHSESHALIKSKGRGCTLIVARVLSDGTPANAKPCLVCEEMIKIHGNIKEVRYTV